MSRPLFVLLVVLLVAAIFLLMWWGWRGRTTKGSGSHIRLPEAPDRDTATHLFLGQYVATTPEGSPYERVAVRGLTFRGRAQLAFSPVGVAVCVDGEDGVLIPAEQIVGAARATSRVGKTVEPGGLALIVWEAAVDGESLRLESSFRLANPELTEEFLHEVRQLAQVGSGINHSMIQEDA